MTYSASGTTTGTIVSYTPTFAPVASGAPKKSVLCTSKKQSFTTTYSATTADVAAAKTGAVGMVYSVLKPTK